MCVNFKNEILGFDETLKLSQDSQMTFFMCFMLVC